MWSGLPAVVARLSFMDEVLIGFRLHPGLASHYLGVSPDLATVGKAIGNGYAVAALVGGPDLMSAFEDGRVAHDNPVACAAVNASMKIVDNIDYGQLRQSDALREQIRISFAENGGHVVTCRYGTVFTLCVPALLQVTTMRLRSLRTLLSRQRCTSHFVGQARCQCSAPMADITICARSSEAIMQQFTECFATAAKQLTA